MEINVVDTKDPGLAKPMILLQSLKKIVIQIDAGRDGVKRMVDAVILAAGCLGSIDVLRIYAHGRSGVINIAGGTYDAQDELSAIGMDNLGKLGIELQRLTHYFASGARVELQGCTVAEGSKGEMLLMELAHLWGVRVQAQTKESPLGAVQFSGGVVEANPAGGLSCVVGTPLS
jgi:hypothetical protein